MIVVDIYRSRLRVAGLLIVACALVAFCTWIIYSHPANRHRSPTPYSFDDFMAYSGIVVFGLGALTLLSALFQRGPVVSVGPDGIFDRRLSTDWIPWNLIRSISSIEINRHKMLVIDIFPDVDAALPVKKRARFSARLNHFFGSYGYWVSAIDLRGGFPALSEAVLKGQKRTRV